MDWNVGYDSKVCSQILSFLVHRTYVCDLFHKDKANKKNDSILSSPQGFGIQFWQNSLKPVDFTDQSHYSYCRGEPET